MAGLRDYLYVSARKTQRIAATLPSPALKRLRELSFNAGPVGAGITLSDPGQSSLIALVGAVEEALEKAYRIRLPFDPDLKVGHWFRATGVQMAYGIPVGYGETGDYAAVFTARHGESFVLLSGSAEYFLDRSANQSDVGSSMSAPQAISALLAAASDETGIPEEDVGVSKWISVGYPISNLHSGLSEFGLHPLTFLARATHISYSDQPSTDPHMPGKYVVGTPLYVALAAPD